MFAIKQIIVPTTLFIFVALVAIITIIQLFQYLNKRLIIRSIQSIVEKKDGITPEVIHAIAAEKHDPYTDLKKGIIFFAMAIAIFIFSMNDAFSEYLLAQSSLQGMAVFPLLMAFTYCGFYFFTAKK